MILPGVETKKKQIYITLRNKKIKCEGWKKHQLQNEPENLLVDVINLITAVIIARFILSGVCDNPYKSTLQRTLLL